MIAAKWLFCRDRMLLWMKLQLLSMPKTSKTKLMEELITLEVNAAKVFEKSPVEVFFSSMELQFIKLQLEMQLAFHCLQPSQLVASFFAMSASIAFWTTKARCSHEQTVARTEQSSFVRICHSVMSWPGATEQMTLLRCVFSMARIITKASGLGNTNKENHHPAISPCSGPRIKTLPCLVWKHILISMILPLCCLHTFSHSLMNPRQFDSGNLLLVIALPSASSMMKQYWSIFVFLLFGRCTNIITKPREKATTEDSCQACKQFAFQVR